MDKIKDEWIGEKNKLEKVIKKAMDEKKEFEQQKKELIQKIIYLRLVRPARK